MTYIEPALPFFLLLILAGFVMRRRHGLGRTLLATGSAGLFLWSWAPAAWLCARTLEARYAERTIPEGSADAIVVLSASAYRRNASRPETLPGPGTAERCYYAAWLYRNWHSVPIVVSGGDIDPGPGTVALSTIMRRLLEHEGVPASSIWEENRSTSTYENAVYSAELLRSRGIGKIALVTEAYHMRRAEGCFRKQGLAVIPAPCAFRVLDPDAGWKLVLPSAQMMLWNDATLHEWIGLGWYRLKGRI